MQEELIIEVIKENSKFLIESTYNDLVKKPMRAISQGIESIFKIVFFPTNLMANKINDIMNDVNKKITDIPSEKLIDPQLNIIGPALEGFKYIIDQDILIEMFKNILSNSLNSDYSKYIHPSYSEIIFKLNFVDAKILEWFSERRKMPIFPLYEIRPHYNSSYLYDPDWVNIYTEIKIEDIDDYEIASSLERLESYGFLKIHFGHSASTLVDFNNFKNSEGLNELLRTHKEHNEKSSNSEKSHINPNQGIIMITNFGKGFIKTCISE